MKITLSHSIGWANPAFTKPVFWHEVALMKI